MSGKGKKKGAKKKGDDDGPDQEEMAGILSSQVECLKQRLVLEQERSNMSRSKEDDIRQREVELANDLDDQKKKTGMIVREMTDQYNKMEEDLSKSIKTQEGKVQDQQRQIQELKERRMQLIQEKEDIYNEKEEEIRKLKKNIDEMSSDFAEMLKDTLTKMQERIEFANKTWEDDTDANMLKKFDEMNAGK